MFFTTIKLNNGVFDLLDFHLNRIQKTIEKHFQQAPKLNSNLVTHLAEKHPNGLFRVRVNFDSEIKDIQVFPYQIKELEKIRIVENARLDYSLKYSDRSYFDAILANYSGYDDILFTQNGFLTDTTFCNLILKKNGQWFTPKTYLLPGIKRQFLLEQKQIEETDISIKDLTKFEEICFINAMRDFEKIYKFKIQENSIYLENIAL